MADIDITVADVKWPQPGKKTGAIKDTEGRYWGVWPDKLGAFTPGNRYKITDYESREYNGKTYTNIKAFQPLGGGAPTPPYAPAGLPAPQAPTQARVGGPAAPADDSARRMDIFICGAFNNIMANPNVNPMELTMMDMVDTVHKLKGAWLGVFGPSPLPPRRKPDNISTGQAPAPDDLNDEIPF